MKMFHKFQKDHVDLSAVEKERQNLRKHMNKAEKGMTQKTAAKKPKKELTAKDISLGDAVKVLSMNLKGTVSSRPDNKGFLFVQMGIIRSKVHISDLELIDEGKLRFYSNKKLVQYLTNQESEEENIQKLLKTQYEDFIATKSNETTINLYRITMNRIKEYCDFDSLSIEEIDIDWLNGYVEKLRKEHNRTNSIAIHLRCIRAVLNFARKRGVTKEYVFSMYRIKTEETVKRSLTVEQLRTLYHAKLTKIRSKHRDVFFLMFVNIIT